MGVEGGPSSSPDPRRETGCKGKKGQGGDPVVLCGDSCLASQDNGRGFAGTELGMSGSFPKALENPEL